MQREHDGFTRRRNGVGKGCLGGASARQRPRQQQECERGVPKKRHGYTLSTWPPEKPTPSPAAYAVMALVRFSATLSRKPVADRQRWSAPTSEARSLVMKPASTVSTQAFSSVSANLPSASLLSSLARCDSPRVQAKIEAIELVEVSLPF